MPLSPAAATANKRINSENQTEGIRRFADRKVFGSLLHVIVSLHRMTIQMSHHPDAKSGNATFGHADFRLGFGERLQFMRQCGLAGRFSFFYELQNKSRGREI
jgi:hypothetical protein